MPQHLAAGRARQAGEDAEQRGFAGTGGAQQRQNLIRINGQIQRRDDLDSIVTRLVVELFNLSCFNQGLRHAAYYRSPDQACTKFIELSCPGWIVCGSNAVSGQDRLKPCAAPPYSHYVST